DCSEEKADPHEPPRHESLEAADDRDARKQQSKWNCETGAACGESEQVESAYYRCGLGDARLSENPRCESRGRERNGSGDAPDERDMDACNLHPEELQAARRRRGKDGERHG